jgi:CRP/FNR family cyclic AMP-dependent transcriptional regulator
MTMTTVDRVVALHRVPLLADVPGRTLAALAMRAKEVRVAPGDVVIEQGAVEDHLFAVVEGRFVARDGERTLRELGPGATVGELAALAPEPRSASVTALEDGLLLRIDKALLDELLADRPELARAVITSLVRMVRSTAASG